MQKKKKLEKRIKKYWISALMNRKPSYKKRMESKRNRYSEEEKLIINFIKFIYRWVYKCFNFVILVLHVILQIIKFYLVHGLFKMIDLALLVSFYLLLFYWLRTINHSVTNLEHLEAKMNDNSSRIGNFYYLSYLQARIRTFAGAIGLLLAFRAI